MTMTRVNTALTKTVLRADDIALRCRLLQLLCFALCCRLPRLVRRSAGIVRQARFCIQTPVGLDDSFHIGIINVVATGRAKYLGESMEKRRRRRYKKKERRERMKRQVRGKGEPRAGG